MKEITNNSGQVGDDTNQSQPTMSQIVNAKLNLAANRPLVKSPTTTKSEKQTLSDIIKPLETLVNTGEVLDDNVKITDVDKDTLGDLERVLSFNPKSVDITPEPIRADTLSDEDRRRLFNEEKKRRGIEDERFEELTIALEEDEVRRGMFQEEIRIMKEEFNIYLEKTFPEFTNGKLVDREKMDEMKREAMIRKSEMEQEKKKLQLKKIDRLSKEKKRKLKEAKFKFHRLKPSEVNTFFEEDVLIEQREKISKNPELKGLNKIQKTINDFKEMEIRLGRSIVSHRDIVESDDSDFDTKSYLDSDDILIRPEFNRNREDEIRKEIMLKELRYKLKPNRIEDDFIDNNN
tara:strand:- start:45 stop:1085 length:1041 start_codon:yes stop_codon:yes gene_type:complete